MSKEIWKFYPYLQICKKGIFWLQRNVPIQPEFAKKAFSDYNSLKIEYTVKTNYLGLLALSYTKNNQ